MVSSSSISPKIVALLADCQGSKLDFRSRKSALFVGEVSPLYKLLLSVHLPTVRSFNKRISPQNQWNLNKNVGVLKNLVTLAGKLALTKGFYRWYLCVLSHMSAKQIRKFIKKVLTRKFEIWFIAVLETERFHDELLYPEKPLDVTCWHAWAIPLSVLHIRITSLQGQSTLTLISKWFIREAHDPHRSPDRKTWDWFIKV